jgi:hypothetical protein
LQKKKKANFRLVQWVGGTSFCLRGWALRSGLFGFWVRVSGLFEFGGCGGSLRGAAGRFAVRAGFGFATALAAGFFAGNGLETGPAGVPGAGLLCGSHGLLEADCGVFVGGVGSVSLVGRCGILAES